MSEQQNQQNEGNEQQQAQSQTQERQTQQQDNEPRIPKHRLDEESRKRREAEQKLQQYEQERQQQEEQNAQQQGEYQKLAETRKNKLDKAEARIKELENQIVTGERYRTFAKAAQGVIIPDAVDDAFSMLSEDEFNNADTSDENSYRMLAQNLAERKPYLADGMRGAGSGGSARPVLNGSGRGKAARASTIAELNRGKHKRAFK